MEELASNELHLTPLSRRRRYQGRTRSCSPSLCPLAWGSLGLQPGGPVAPVTLMHKVGTVKEEAGTCQDRSLGQVQHRGQEQGVRSRARGTVLQEELEPGHASPQLETGYQPPWFEEDQLLFLHGGVQFVRVVVGELLRLAVHLRLLPPLLDAHPVSQRASCWLGSVLWELGLEALLLRKEKGLVTGSQRKPSLDLHVDGGFPGGDAVGLATSDKLSILRIWSLPRPSAGHPG